MSQITSLAQSISLESLPKSQQFVQNNVDQKNTRIGFGAEHLNENTQIFKHCSLSTSKPEFPLFQIIYIALATLFDIN